MSWSGCGVAASLISGISDESRAFRNEAFIHYLSPFRNSDEDFITNPIVAILRNCRNPVEISAAYARLLRNCGARGE
jgi:hypothetical protein